MLLLSRISVDSSMLEAVGYDPESNTLVVVFNTGATWAYSEVEPEVFEGLLQADSVGRYMNSCIIGCYPDYKVRQGRDFKWKKS